jgi:type III restriction enzyme
LLPARVLSSPWPFGSRYGSNPGSSSRHSGFLSSDEPLRFIFSHSALREGWDNPNVFQICTLNETKSAVKKRQEIGRGLRLPVDQNGRRVFDESVNRLYVMANESYEDFARALQTEYEEECGVTFGRLCP